MPETEEKQQEIPRIDIGFRVTPADDFHQWWRNPMAAVKSCGECGAVREVCAKCQVAPIAYQLQPGWGSQNTNAPIRLCDVCYNITVRAVYMSLGFGAQCPIDEKGHWKDGVNG